MTMNFILQPWQLLLAVLASWVHHEQQKVVEFYQLSQADENRKDHDNAKRFATAGYIRPSILATRVHIAVPRRKTSRSRHDVASNHERQPCEKCGLGVGAGGRVGGRVGVLDLFDLFEFLHPEPDFIVVFGSEIAHDQLAMEGGGAAFFA